ncbi:CPBP family intramembrane metalloprotease [Mycobacterium simiae]|uniref:CPBP family intramembrane metalloprotease n=1 Tax=Mycobacterium simiae TaxID=1784 RepID=A0A5B1BKN6_MYCSI|nr:CPBP family intramembrane glutamic endopeptidase [Mycobacterium simiae]KAA1249247.1 CPBP family intramembrane metalloprotease [Mycobacterium simiae]
MSQSTARPSAIADIRRAITNVAVPHHEAPPVVLRRRIIVAVVLVIGAVVMGLSMSRRPGEPTFYWLTLTLAAVWATGALASGPLHLGGICWRGRNQRPVITGTTLGLLLGGVFLLGGLVVRQIAAVSALTVRVLQFADHGSLLVVLIALINGVAEEMFFRGALYTALGRIYPVMVSTVVYIAAIMASGNPMLGFAAVILGGVCAWERRATGGVLAPILTHAVWGLIMVLALPPLFGV